MSYTAQDLALRTNFAATKKYTLVAIASFASNEGICKPSVQTIAQRASLSDREVQRNIAELASEGYIERIYRQGRSALTRLTDKFYDLARGDVRSPTGVTHGHRHESVTDNPIPKTAAVDTLAGVAPDGAMSVFKTEPEQPDSQTSAAAVVQVVPEPVPVQPAVQVAAMVQTATVTEVQVNHAELNQTALPMVQAEAIKASITDAPEHAYTAPTPAAAALVSTAPIDAPTATPVALPDAQTITAATAVAAFDALPAELQADFAAHRKAKKRPAKITGTEAIDIMMEAIKARMPLVEVVKTLVVRNWTRFNADWVPAWASPAAGNAGQNVTPSPVPVPYVPLSDEERQRVKTLLDATRERMKALPQAGPLAWAHRAIERKRAGEFVKFSILESACAALGLDRRMLV